MIYSAQDAAALLGQGVYKDQILTVMREAWQMAHRWHRERLNPPEGDMPPALDVRALQSSEMLSLESGSSQDACDWYYRDSPFEGARFTSAELERWQGVMARMQGIESRYFAVSVECPASSAKSDKAASQGRADGNKNSVRWTPEFKAEVAAYRAVHGTAATAKKFDISTGRIRRMLPVRGNATPNAFQALVG